MILMFLVSVLKYFEHAYSIYPSKWNEFIII